jgi:cytochrome P450
VSLNCSDCIRCLIQCCLPDINDVEWSTHSNNTLSLSLRTGITLSTTLILLAKHPQYAKKLREELAKSKSPGDCEYLKFVLKESSRLLPVAAMGSVRLTGRDFDAGNGEIIPKGANVFMPQIASNRNEDVFDDPETFNPDRWYNATTEMKNTVMTFSMGVRNCVGQALATAELDSILPRIVSQYDFEIEDEGSLKFFLLLRHVGTKLRAKPCK